MLCRILTGLDLTAPRDPRRNAYHVSGMVSYAVLQYLRATDDRLLLREDGFGDILTGVGRLFINLLSQQRGSGYYTLKGRNKLWSREVYTKNIPVWPFGSTGMNREMFTRKFLCHHLEVWIQKCSQEYSSVIIWKHEIFTRTYLCHNFKVWIETYSQEHSSVAIWMN